jgi:hypothetical protein
LSQVLDVDRSCRAAVRKFLACLAAEKGLAASPNSASYCNARARLPLKNLELIWKQAARQLEGKTSRESWWHERNVKVIDGSGLSMPDTLHNQRMYPQSKRQTPGCGFPTMRIVAAFSLATGAIIGVAKSALNCSERTLFRSLWYLLHPGDVVLADSGFCSYADFFFLKERGIDCVMRNHQRRLVGINVLKRISRGDRLVYWTKMKPCPTWLEKEQWTRVPATLLVREVQFSVEVRGFKTRTITVATTLVDHKTYTKQDLADLYHQRWKAELFLRDIKTTMGMDVLRCKTPDMVHKEIAMYLIAYNLVRALMWQSALDHNAPADRLSFKGAITTITAWAPFTIGRKRSRRQWKKYLDLLAKCIANDLIPNRPNRQEPRVRKRRPKNYQLMNKPRHLCSEIQHRNKYAKPLS